ncbi:MAG TPA: hypothetical protein VF172_05040 [Nitrososphaera sp.]|jgi:hypothetical protein
MNDIISWDKAIGRKVKSSDEKDLGRVQSITHDYIQTREGTFSKNYYFIPKYYLSGFDGDNLWVSLTKDEVKSRFEKEKEPELAELETPEYKERRAAVMQQYPEFASSIPANMVQMPWDKIIGKKVKSSDKKDLGDVESISSDYIEVKEGMLNKKHYFIPKYYIQGFDGDNLYASLTKNDLKDRFERDSPPSPSELQTATYREQTRSLEANHPQFVHGVPWMAKEPSMEIPVDYSGTTYKIPWDQLIHKHVRTTDNIDVGYVERIGNEFVVVREGVSDVHIYYVPKAYIRDYDGSQLWIDAPSGLVRSKFERESEPTIEELRALARNAPRFKRAAEPEPPQAGLDSVTVETKVNLEETTGSKTTE